MLLTTVFTFMALLQIASAAQDQAGPPQPRFDVVSIKSGVKTVVRILPNSGPVQVPFQGFRYTPGRLTCNLPLSSLIQEAYSIKPWQLIGPDWVSVDRYDLAATMPPDTGKPAARLMLQTMLAERFGLRFHRERKEFPVYALVVAKGGLRMEPVVPRPESYDIKMSAGQFTATGMPLSNFADSLSRMADLPVIDQTGLPGVYRIDMRWTPNYQNEPKHWDAGIFAAVEQLGLKLEQRKVPIESIVIDHAERTPTAN